MFQMIIKPISNPW